MKKVIALLILAFGGTMAIFILGILCFLGGGIALLLLPLIVYFAVSFAERLRTRYLNRYQVGCVCFVMVAELPSILAGGTGIALAFLAPRREDIVEAIGDYAASVLMFYWCGIALLITVGTIICAVAEHFACKKELKRLSDRTEV